jgi:predicted phosphodiesterase
LPRRARPGESGKRRGCASLSDSHIDSGSRVRQIYASVKLLEERTAKKVDLLICCGDFQAVRNETDLLAMNVPQKYLTMVRPLPFDFS